MQKILVKTTSDPFLFQWMQMPVMGVLASAKREIGTLAELSAEVDMGMEAAHITFLAPSMSVHVRQLSFVAAEKKHLAKTVPFTLEDEMICDASDLHCVMTKPTDDTLWVAAVQKQDLDRWLKRFEEVGLSVNECVPEQVLLLNETNDWNMYYDNGEFLIRCGEPQIHGIDGNNIALALELATEGYSKVPAVINLVLNEEADKHDALQHIPEALHSYIHTEVSPLPALLKQSSEVNKQLNLLQGKYAKSSDWMVNFKKWKKMLWLFLAALLVHVGVSFAEYRQSNSELKNIRSQISVLHKKVFPKGNARNSRKALESELKRLGGNGGSTKDFLGLLLDASTVIEQQKGFSANGLTFNASNGEMELDVLLKDQTAVEELKSALHAKSLEVKLLNSSEKDNQVRARMKIKSQS